MVDTTRMSPLWIIGIVVGILMISLINIFFNGSYSRLGSSQFRIYIEITV